MQWGWGWGRGGGGQVYLKALICNYLDITGHCETEATVGTLDCAPKGMRHYKM